MSFRVSIPLTAHLIGSAQPPRRSSSRNRPRGLINGVASRLSVAILSCPCRSRSESFRRNPRSSSLWLPLRSTSTSNNSRGSSLAEARLHPDYPKRSSASKKSPTPHLVVTAETVLHISRLHEPPQNHSAFGSLRRLPIHAHAAIRATLRPHSDGPGLPPPALTRVANLPAIFHAGSSMGTLPSEASLHSCRRALSDSTVPPAVFHLAVPRLRGFEHLSLTCTLRCTARCERTRSQSEAFSRLTIGRSSHGRFPPSRMTSRPRPTLLQGSSHGLHRSRAPLVPLAGRL
jgi:hypothetical protein